jgi:hypothetical protein
MHTYGWGRLSNHLRPRDLPPSLVDERNVWRMETF